QVSALTSSLTSPAPLISFPTPTPPSAIYTLSLHDALPISQLNLFQFPFAFRDHVLFASVTAKHQCLLLKEDIDASLLRRQKGHRSEEHTCELQSRFDLVCRLLLEKTKSAARLLGRWYCRGC